MIEPRFTVGLDLYEDCSRKDINNCRWVITSRTKYTSCVKNQHCKGQVSHLQGAAKADCCKFVIFRGASPDWFGNAPTISPNRMFGKKTEAFDFDVFDVFAAS